MSGVDIAGALLLADAAVIAMFPATQIKAGRLPDDVILPALLLRKVSGVDRQTLTRGATRRTTDRVSVTVRAANYRDQREGIRLVRACLAGQAGNIGGGLNVSILTAGTGPDVNGPGDSFEQAQDFRVSYDEPT
jgi:hypothetical protein